MDASRFDRIARLFAANKLSRRQALVASTLAAVGLDRAAAQDATPAVTPEPVQAEPWTGDKTMYMFVQTFQSGTITPTEGVEDRYTVTLEPGTGETIYFGDRPSRDVGVTETPRFLEGLGFPEDNPPNAALIVETEPGETDIAVVELFNPMYDPTTHGVTYDVEVLANWQEDLEMEFSEAPADLAALAPEFGTAHLFIDDCPQTEIICRRLGDDGRTDVDIGYFENLDSCWNYDLCYPCEPYGHVQPDRCATMDYWTRKCNEALPACKGPFGNCKAISSWPFLSAFC